MHINQYSSLRQLQSTTAMCSIPLLIGIVARELFENVDLDRSSFLVFAYITYNLDCHSLGFGTIPTVKHLTECTLANKVDDFICASQATSSMVGQ
jgi:hypothetical protein